MRYAAALGAIFLVEAFLAFAQDGTLCPVENVRCNVTDPKQDGTIYCLNEPSEFMECTCRCNSQPDGDLCRDLMVNSEGIHQFPIYDGTIFDSGDFDHLLEAECGINLRTKRGGST